MAGPDAFRFLGIERRICSAEDWNRSDWPKLWLYNAHYFDDLLADDAEARTQWHRNLIRRWVDENPPAQGNGWEPYPASLRIVNWIKWALAGNTLDGDARHSLAVQARHLRRRLEIHLLGNHLWANAKALVFAGAFFQGDEAAHWRECGLRLLRREMEEQFLADGGHFERSPMYHAILLEDVLDLVQLAAILPGLFADVEVARWRALAGRMLRWLRVMSHPDGGIALFNDAAFDIAPTLAQLEAHADALGIARDNDPLGSLEVLADSGYVRMMQGPAVLIADVGEIGPDYLPGHAHADTLSFELSLHGRRILVNGGTSTYDAGSLRLAQRGTAMHNTVEVDGMDSSEVWSSFRVARRARPMRVSWRRESDALVLEAAHDGYRRLPGKVVHLRQWRLQGNGFAVTDTLEGRYGTAVARFRFAPGFVADGHGGADGRSCTDGLSLAWTGADPGARMTAGTWYPRFGDALSCLVLENPIVGGGSRIEFGWT